MLEFFINMLFNSLVICTLMCVVIFLAHIHWILACLGAIISILVLTFVTKEME